ncbi:unnamed protein product [Leptidea sinapis]|uniref:Uncharacterized protein n=1 Tax=Leptidea sinapis TaxID=189913 RepID=A0A5E4Q169_9NEOP|nr:unnamed protein product [Leptidea sinapis]
MLWVATVSSATVQSTIPCERSSGVSLHSVALNNAAHSLRPAFLIHNKMCAFPLFILQLNAFSNRRLTLDKLLLLASKQARIKHAKSTNGKVPVNNEGLFILMNAAEANYVNKLSCILKSFPGDQLGPRPTSRITQANPTEYETK